MRWQKTHTPTICNDKPSLWRLYVDDILAIWSHGHDKLDALLHYLNNLNPLIQFTVEKHDGNKALPFLDILLQTKSDGTLSHIVYRKPTHTDRYLYCRSFHHPRMKSSVCKALVHRARSICDSQHLDGEFKHLKKVLGQNGLPTDKMTEEHCKPNRSKQEYVFTVVLPYTGPASHKIERILSKENIKVYHTTFNMLFQRHFTHEVKREKTQHPEVYRIACECGLAYIGETGRTTTIRKKRTLHVLR